MTTPRSSSSIIIAYYIIIIIAYLFMLLFIVLIMFLLLLWIISNVDYSSRQSIKNNISYEFQIRIQPYDADVCSC